MEFQLAMDKVKTQPNMITKNRETFEIPSVEEHEAEVKWSTVPWREIEKSVFKLQKKIYKGLMRTTTTAKCVNTRKRY
jgi:hypothetical protein